jgi:hypothetical protein
MAYNGVMFHDNDLEFEKRCHTPRFIEDIDGKNRYPRLHFADCYTLHAPFTGSRYRLASGPGAAKAILAF